MKRTLLISLLTLLLCCGCNQKPTESAETEPATTENGIICEDVNLMQEFDSLEAFISSDLYAQMQNEEYKPYVPDYAAAGYEVTGVRALHDVYEISLYHAEKDKRILYSVTCNSIFETTEDLAQLYQNEPEKNVILTTEKDGVVYEGYVMHTPFQEELVYNLHYIPMDGYDVYIHSDSPTPEEAIAYIHEFDLVPAE